MIEWIPIVGMVTSSAMVIWVVAIVSAARTRRVEAQVQMQSKLIERFGSAPELIEFLHSPAGKQFVAGVQGAPIALARERIMSGFTRSIIMTALGAAFIFIALWDDDSGWYIPAAIVFSLGIGYMLATFVSWKFSKGLNENGSFPPAVRNES